MYGEMVHRQEEWKSKAGGEGDVRIKQGPSRQKAGKE
jgi:hypothetical protein